MSLEHILLGMLKSPASGFDLRSEFDNGARFFWSAELSQIYSTLRRMESKGWLKSRIEPSPKGPDRRVYARTEIGSDEFRDWLLGGPVTGNERFAYIGQLIFMGELNDLSVTLEFLMALREQLGAAKQVLTNASQGVPGLMSPNESNDTASSSSYGSSEDRVSSAAANERQVQPQPTTGCDCEVESPPGLPHINLLDPPTTIDQSEIDRNAKQRASTIEETLEAFGFAVKVANIETGGPLVCRYELELEKGQRISKIHAVADDLAIALRVESSRILTRIPGRNTVGIEVPHAAPRSVRMREVMGIANPEKPDRHEFRVPLFLGLDVAGVPFVVDLSVLPHLLISGRGGSGRTACLDAIVASILMTNRPEEVRLLLIDAKMVNFSRYRQLPHLLCPTVTDALQGEAMLRWTTEEMERRYRLFSSHGVRDLPAYGKLHETLPANTHSAGEPERLPRIVIVVDELADLMLASAKEVEQHIIRLAAKGRAVGIHLVLATAKPTVDVVTGLIKANLPARIAFQVASRTDSRVILDQSGAELLLGKGDMLFLDPNSSNLVRAKGVYLNDDELDRVVAGCKGTQEFFKQLLDLQTQNSKTPSQDDLYERAVELTIAEDRGSVSMIQRKLSVGYGRAARLLDRMEEGGIVASYNGSKARAVLVTKEQWRSRLQGDDTNSAPDASRRSISESALAMADIDIATFHSHLSLQMGVMSLTAKVAWCDRAISTVQARIRREI